MFAYFWCISGFTSPIEKTNQSSITKLITKFGDSDKFVTKHLRILPCFLCGVASLTKIVPKRKTFVYQFVCRDKGHPELADRQRIMQFVYFAFAFATQQELQK